MARKRKAQSKQQPLPKLRERAKQALQQGEFREALELHKQLLQQQPEDTNREGLAAAYLGRAKALASRGHYREAAALWENMAGSCGEREAAHYIEWLLLGGRVERGTRLLLEADALPHASRLHSLLALLLLNQPEATGNALPADSPLWSQRNTMLAALQAYYAGDDAQLREHLKAIPFRSPYRELRSLLQALVRQHHPDEAREQLQRIPSNSPLAPLAQSLLDHHQADDLDLLGLPEPLRNFLLSLRGWDQTQRQMLERFPKADQENPKAVLRFALGLETVDPKHLRRFCLAWLPGYPDGVSSVAKRVGRLSSAEREWLKAQTSERRDNINLMETHWPRCADALLVEGQPLAAALVFRHLAQALEKAEGASPWETAPQRYRQRALQLDPEDRDNHLKLIAMAEQQGDLTLQQSLTEQAVKQFPEDVEIRLKAAQLLHRNRAFKQAAEHAAAVLARDSLNRQARRQLATSYIGLACQHVQRGRCDLARKALHTLQKYPTDKAQESTLPLIGSLIALADKDRATAQRHLRTALDGLGAGLATRFQFLVYGRQMQLPQRSLTRLYNEISPAKQEPPPTPETLFTLVGLIQDFRVDDTAHILDTLDQLYKPLKDAARLKLEETQYHTLLETLYEVEHYNLLACYTKAACRHYGPQPRFSFFGIFSRCEGNEEAISFQDQLRLEQLLGNYEVQDDPQLLHWINDFLGDAPFYPGPPGFLGDDDELETMDLPPGLPPMPPEVRMVIQQIMQQLGTDDPLEAMRFILEMQDDAELPPLPILPPRGRR